MSEFRERRPRGRRKVQFEEVLPSTDLPPLVQGDLRCFLVVDIGKILWSSTATAQVPPASHAYVQLRWWGETSNGTLFKPASSKNERTVKSRCRFGVRSGAKQMSAYFVDMGSIVLEVLTSPKSVPLGRIQIPKVANLSSSNPIHDFFPIISPSSRKIGELQIHIRFKSLEGAYDVTTDTGTDTSMSSRSRPPSEVGRRSRSHGSSVGSRSNRGSARSRSSSTGSRKSGSRRKISTKSKVRRRSRSSESNASSASKKSHSKKKASAADSTTPRGIDDLLKQNGHNFYGSENKSPKKSNLKDTQKEQKENGTKPGIQLAPDAISVLLQRGNRLREDILKSQLEPEILKTQFGNTGVRNAFGPTSLAKMVPSAWEMPTQPPPIQMVPPVKLPRTITPVKEQRQDLDMRFVDLVFGSQEFKGHSEFFSGIDSHTGSPLSSMISDLSDNPLYDDSLLQQMFYDNAAPPSVYNTHRVNDKLRELEHRQTFPVDTKQEVKQISNAANTRIENLASRIPGITVKRLLKLQRVRTVQILIETLTTTENYTTNSNKSKSLKSLGRGSKPPVPSPKGNRKNGTYFVEFRVPDLTSTKRDHPSSITTSHDVTRVASRRVTTSNSLTTVIFEECCEFQFEFNEENLLKWSNENMEFVIYCRKPTDKKALPVGIAKLQLHNILTSNSTEYELKLDVTSNFKSCGKLKVFIELVPEFDNKQNGGQQQNEKIPTDEVEIEEEMHQKNVDDVPNKEPSEIDVEVQGSSIALSPSTSVLYMMLIVQEGSNIPGTTVISPTQGTTSHAPNVFLVCRTLTSGENEKTPVIWGQTNPRFDFVQISPLKLDSALLSRMENNFVIIEIWTKISSSHPHSDKLLGLVKLSTHHFAQSLKDDEIARVVLNSQHPLISVDEPTPVIDLFTGQERGHLQVTLALGTQDQIAMLRKVKIAVQDSKIKHHHLEEQKTTESDHKVSGPVEHTFEVNLIKLNGFKPHDGQVWGETDCFVQYQFPMQKNSDDSSESTSDETQKLDLASMENYRSDATLCVPDPVFNDARHHTFHPPPSVPVQRILLSCCYSDGLSGGIPFELWSRYYHPNVRDQLLAKGMLPVAKIGALVSMTTKKVSEQTFYIPMEFVDPEQSHDRSAGKLEVHIKYKSSGTTLEHLQRPMHFKKPVILRLGLLRACGLKAAAIMACRHGNDDDGDMKYCADVGVNTYVEIKTSFLPDEETRTSRIVAQSFTPEFQHHVEIACPLVSYHRDIKPISLAELMISGEIEFTIWHRPESERKKNEDKLIATLAVSMRSLLHKTSGVHSWFALKPSERSRRIGEDCITVGGLELSMSFGGSNDLDLILKSAKATGWSLPHFESRLLRDDVTNVVDITGNDCVTFAVTVTNAWLPRNDTFLCGRTSVDKNANVFLRYKFFDHDSVTSSMCPLVSKQPRSIDARFENLISARLAHKKSFVCKKSRPLNYYLREERLELQLWLTHSKNLKKARPLDCDKLLGSCYLDLSTIADLQKEQHISGSFDIFKAGADDLGGGQVRVYVSVKPGDIVDPIPDPVQEKIISEEEQISTDAENCNTAILAKQISESAFSAVITVERAMHLSLVNDHETEKQTEPNCFVSFDAMDESVVGKNMDETKMVTVATKFAMTTSSPIWNEGKEVYLPRTLLSGTQGALLLKVWHRDQLYLNTESAAFEQQSMPAESVATTDTRLLATDRMLGFATVDLSVLRAGLRDVNGWYNVLDIHGQCQGQLKVAVTPTSPQDASQPLTARSSETNQSTYTHALSSLPPLGSKGVHFLHQSPIDIPVQTPSGSMYFPGLRSSAQTVPTTCKMSESEENAFLRSHDNRQNVMPKFSQDFAQNGNFHHHGPSASMFRYSSSDQQQVCLVNTLEKQIKELEEIKVRFEHRRATGFAVNDASNKIEVQQPKILTDSVGTTTQTNSQNNKKEETNEIPELEERPFEPSQDTQIGGTVLKLHPPRTRSFDAIPALEIDKMDSHRRMSSSESLKTKSIISSHSASELVSNGHDGPHNKTVHLSLYEPRKNTDFDDHALSDNELNLDVEFVQPRSLNESMCSDFQQNGSKSSKINFDPTFEKPPFSATQHENKHPHFSEPSALTPGRSEGHSVLEDTSLWLSGSTLRVSGFSSEDDDFEPNLKTNIDQTNSGYEEFENPHPRLEGFSQIPDIFEEDTQIKEIETSQNRLESEKELESVDETVNAQQPIREKSEGSRSAPSEYETIDGPIDTPESPLIVKHVNNDYCPSSEKTSVSTSSELSQTNDPEQDQSLKSNSSVTSEPNFDSLSRKKKDEMHSPAEQRFDTVTKQSSALPEKSLDNFNLAAKGPCGPPSDENVCPNSKTRSKPVARNQNKLFPSFFPPTRDLEASMRALQEATLKHKHDLLKKREVTSLCDENEPSTMTKIQPKTKKHFPKPADVTDEKTQRLARIFRTKFS